MSRSDEKPDDGSIPAPVDAEVAAATAAPDVNVEPKPELKLEPSTSGSIDVALSNPKLEPSTSGSIDVAMSSPGVPKPPKLPDDAAPVAAADAHDSAPVSSGRVTSMTAVAATGPAEHHPRSKRITDLGKDMLGKGVTALGGGLEKVGEGVGKLGEVSHKVPVVGPAMERLGEGIASVGESITELPRVARTRRGALLVRSLIVGFLLIASWIAVIVLLQVRNTDSPDFRPHAERILKQIGNGRTAIEEMYEKASPRFQEVVRKERFVDDMLDLNATCGKFVEVTAINDSFVSYGPTGRIGRMSLQVDYERGNTRAAVSLHWIDNEWKLMGVSVEVPPNLKITQAAREQRVAACKDSMDPKRCDVHTVADEILQQLRDGKADKVWDEASDVFQKQEPKARFVATANEQQRVLGEYRRIITVTEAKVNADKIRATFDVLVEYSQSNIRVIFGLTRNSQAEKWKLRSLKVALPMPRSEDIARIRDGSGGSGSAGSGSGSGSQAGSGSQKAGSGPQRPPTKK